jgi:hypothetical protein
MTGGVGTGCTINFGEGGYEGAVISFELGDEEVVPVDATTLTSTVHRKKIPVTLIEPTAFTAEIFYDFDNPPPLGTVATAVITFPDTSELAGTGFFVSQSGEIPLEEMMKGSFVFKFDGDTDPEYTPPA